MPCKKPTEEQLEYWNQILSDNGLSMREGSGHGKLVYVGGNEELRIVEKYAEEDGDE